MSPAGSFIKLSQIYSKLSGMNIESTKASLGLNWLPSSNSMFASSPCLQVQKSAKFLNTFLQDRLLDQQVLEDLKAVLKARLDLEDNQDDLSLVILKALQNPQANTFVITNITPAGFNYFEDTQELQIMTPLPIHKLPGSHLFKAIAKLAAVSCGPSTRLRVNKWVGECGLLSDDDSMVQKLRTTTNSSLETDYALMISLQEQDKWHQPKEDSLAKFIPRQIKKSLKYGPVIIHSHVWMDVSEVWYTMFKCGADSHFDFNSKNPETFAEGTIYPEIKMDDVKHMLSGAAERLKDYVVSLMEGMGLEESSIRSACESRPVWDPMWEAAVNQISTAVLLVDVELERAVKKAKVSDNKVPEAKVKTSRPKKGASRVWHVAILKQDIPPNLSQSSTSHLDTQLSSTTTSTTENSPVYALPNLVGRSTLPQPERCRPEVSSTAEPFANSTITSTIICNTPSLPISHKTTMSGAEPCVFSGTIGTPRAIGALQTIRSPALLHHLTPGIATSRFSATMALAKVSTRMTTELVCEDSDDESTNSNDISCNEELKAQLVLNVMRAQQDICLAEKKLADCILNKNTVLGVLYQFKATEAERKLEDANMDIGYVCHSLCKSGIMLYEDSGSVHRVQCCGVFKLQIKAVLREPDSNLKAQVRSSSLYHAVWHYIWQPYTTTSTSLYY
ncbi:hypothetical protein BDR05DRAFT_952573 [Suillus weaverae]|nr:hypothetical protein BDR05DRAFT_952573 [Suillus weaverae]